MLECCKYQFNNNNHFTDVDECNNSLHNCDSYATCMNTNGSFTCMCDVGYSGDGVRCIGESINNYF